MSFQQFSYLPSELRLKIWRLAILSPLDPTSALPSLLRVDLNLVVQRTHVFCRLRRLPNVRCPFSVEHTPTYMHEIESVAGGCFTLDDADASQPLIQTLDSIGLACFEARQELLAHFPARLRVYHAWQGTSPSPRVSRLLHFHPTHDVLNIGRVRLSDIDPRNRFKPLELQEVDYIHVKISRARLREFRSSLESIRAVALGIDDRAGWICTARRNFIVRCCDDQDNYDCGHTCQDRLTAMMQAMKGLEQVYLYMNGSSREGMGARFYRRLGDHPAVVEGRKDSSEVSVIAAVRQQREVAQSEDAYEALRMLEDLANCADIAANVVQRRFADADLGLVAEDGWTPGMGRSPPTLGIWGP